MTKFLTQTIRIFVSNTTSPYDTKSNGRPFDSKSIRKWQIQSDFGRFSKNSKQISACVAAELGQHFRPPHAAPLGCHGLPNKERPNNNKADFNKGFQGEP